MSDVFEAMVLGSWEPPTYNEQFALVVWQRYFERTDEFDALSGGVNGRLPADSAAVRKCQWYAKRQRELARKINAVQGASPAECRIAKDLAEMSGRLQYVPTDLKNRILEDIAAIESALPCLCSAAYEARKTHE